MKKLFFFAAAALALASCSNDETVAQYQGEAISFQTFVGGTTRAADVTTDNIDEFTVEAFKTGETTPYFSNVKFTKQSTTPVTFTSATKYYWPASPSTVDFYAYSPTTNAQISKTDYKTFVVTPSATVSEQVDLVYACTKEKSKTTTAGVTGAVALNFRHTGSKIVVKVKNTAPNLKFEVSGWKVGYLDNSATFTYSDANTDGNNSAQLAIGDWSNNDSPAAANTYSVETTSANAVAASSSTAQYLGASALSATATEGLNMILIPQTTTAAGAYASTTADALPTGSYIALKLKIFNNTTAGEVVADATTKWAMWPVAFTWVPGKKYTYVIDLADGGYWETNNDDDSGLDPILEGAEIKFVSVTVDDWSAADDFPVTPIVNP